MCTRSVLIACFVLLSPVEGEANAFVTQLSNGKETLRSSAIWTLGSSARVRCTCVSPEYQPSWAMLIQRLREMVSFMGLSTRLTFWVKGKYSLPRSTVSEYWPGGRSMVKGCAEIVVCLSTDCLFEPFCLSYITAEPSGDVDSTK